MIHPDAGYEDFILSGITVTRTEERNSPDYRLNHIDLTLSPGEWVNIVGVNGSGKSSLARLFAGLTMEGVTGFCNRGFAGSGPSPYVMQQPDVQLFGETPREEVVFALEWFGLPPSTILEQAEQVLNRTGLLPVADFPWDRLSGGQRQLAAVAAATAGRAPLIVFDEATSMLDDGSRQMVLLAAKRLHQEGTAVVWVTQRMDELDPASRVTALAEGRIVFDGIGERFLFGDQNEPSPCRQCGLRLPYLALLAARLNQLGIITPPFPVTMEEWRKVLEQL